VTHRSDFSAEEWTLLREAPPLAGLRVAVADAGGDYREVAAIAEAYGDAHESWWGPPAGRHVELIDEIVGEGPAYDRSRFGDAPQHLRVDEIVDAAARSLRDAVAVLERTASADEVDDYQRFVLALARRVAEAHKEGAVFGIGGTAVSEEEQAALDELASVMPQR